MKIIAATDFSPAAANAARAAARLARKLGDSLLLVRVVEPPVAVYPELRIPDAALFDAALRESNEAQMRDAVTALRDEGVPVEGRVLIGAPVSSLVAEAAAQRARLIALGSHGRGAVARFFLGSVAERTVLAASCPVLVVPEGTAPFDRWIAGQPLRLTVGLDLDPAGEAVVAELRQLREAGPCDVTLVHTYWPPGEYARLGLPGPRDIIETDPEVVAVLEREIDARFGVRSGPASRLRIHSAWGRPGEALTDEAQADRADVLLMGTRQPHGWSWVKTGSSALAALRCTRTAVLCVPATARPGAAASDVPVPLVRTVLCATDFSELGDAAVPLAYALVRASGGTVELCHVAGSHPPAAAELAYAPPPGLPAARKAELEARLAALVPGDAERLGITTRITVIDGGTPATAILQAARRLGVDGIVLASHGRAGVTRALLASVAEDVLRRSDRPVLIVRPREIA
jgi:nucleotide-binding universal stress UspA family protein